MPLVLYAATALLLLALTARSVRPLSRGAAVVLFTIPLGLTGVALATGDVYGPLDHLYAHEPHAALASRFEIGPPRNVSAVDIYSEFFPWRRAVQASLQRGEWPLWNSDNLCGHPLAAEAQSAPYSPFTLIACLLPAAVSLTYTAAIGLFLAGLCAFLFARELDCSEAASLVAAIGWALGASNVIYIETAMGFATIYAPLLLVAVRRVVRTPGVAAGALLATTLSLTVLVGHPESLFLNVLTGCVYALFELVRRRAAPWRAIATGLAGGVVSLLLCAIFLLPLLEALPQSAELGSKQSFGDKTRGVRGEQVLATLATDLFPHLHLRDWVSPRLSYIGAETAAVGSLILALAAYAVWRRRSSDAIFFAAMTLICMLIGARWAPVADLLQYLPLLEITLHDRLAFMAALGLITLAALGADRLLQTRDFRAAAIVFAITFAFLGGGMLWLQRNVIVATTTADVGRYRVFAELFFLALAALVFAFRPPVRIAAIALIALLAGQRLLSESDTFGTYPAAAAYPPLPILEPLREVREPFRIVGRGLMLPPATNTFYGLEDVRGYEALTLLQFVNTWTFWSEPHGIWFNRVDDLTAPFLSLMNVRFALQSAGLDVPPGWRVITQRDGAMLLENERVANRVFVPARVGTGGATTMELLDRLRAVQDFRAMSWITTPGAIEEHENGPGRIVLRARSRGGEYRFDAHLQLDGWVVISESSWKGWRAYVDGKRVRLSRANMAFLGIPVPAGKHDVRVVYLPSSFVTGRAITFATLAMLFIASVVARYGVRQR